MATRNLSIMFTDIKGFTQRTSASSREAMKALLEQHERLLLPVFAYFDGVVVKTIGDAFLVYFESPTDAVLCGVTIQEVLRQHNAQQAEADRLEVRVAINVGEVELEQADVLGEAVNIAARLEGVTEAGEVWFTDAVYQTMNRTEAPSAEVGERVFKGIPHPIRVYKVIQEPDSELAQQLAQGVQLSDGVPQLAGIRLAAQTAEPAGKSSRCRRTVFVAIIMLLLSGLVVYLIPSTEERVLERTTQLLAEGNPADALVIAHKVLLDSPDNKRVRAVAIKAARAQLDKLVAMGDIKAAQGWLHRQLEAKPYLEPLRSEDMRLEAREAVNTILNESRYSGDYQPEPLQQYLSHFAPSAEAPLVALGMLEGKKVSRHTRFWLMQTALERGHTPDQVFYHFYIQQLEQGSVNHQFFEQLRGDLLQHYPEQSKAWAENALQGNNVLAYMNGWELLKEAGSEKLNDAYYRGLKSLINSYRVEPLQQYRGVFVMQNDSQRRTQLIAFLGALVESHPKFTGSGVLRDEIIRLRKELKQLWAL